jgi:ribosomal protein S18 acetylase RimI-like enzyme
MKIRKAKESDAPELLKLYRAAATTENGIARTPQEISKKFVEDFLDNSLKKGLIFVIENNKKIIAEVHCYKFDPLCFKHTFANLTLVVHPNFQGQGLGKKIFSHLLEEIKAKHREIIRVELFVRQSNPRGIRLYQSLGFVVEGICQNRLLDAKGKLDSDTMMVWINPNFEN